MVDLIYLPLSGLDIIMGMNWLSTNHIMLDCSNKTAMFPPYSFEVEKPMSLYLRSLYLECGRSRS